MPNAINELPLLDLQSSGFQGDIATAVAAVGDLHAERGIARSQRGIEVFTYDRVANTLRDSRFRVAMEGRLDLMGITSEAVRTAHLEAIFARDGADHTRARRACMPWFSKSGAERLRDRARAFIDARLDEAADSAHDYNILEKLTTQLPPYLYCEMIGAPVSDAPFIRHMSDENMLLSAPPLPGYGERIERAVIRTQEYLRNAIEERRAHRGDDLLSYMVGLEEKGEIDQSDIIGVAFNALNGSTDTTSTQICLNLRSLSENPDQWELLKSEPDLVPRAVSELVRYDPIVWSVSRSPFEPIEWEGISITETDMIYLNTFTANNDPSVFADPRRLDIKRPTQSKGALTFGSGPHACLGRMISVMEQEEILRSILERWDSFDVLSSKVNGMMFNISAEDFRIRFKQRALLPA